MKKTKEPMSLSKYMLFQYVIVGSLRMIFSIFGFVPNKKVVFIGILFIFASSIVQLVLFKTDRDKIDELAEINLHEARSDAASLTGIAATIFAFFILLIKLINPLNEFILSLELDWLYILISCSYFFLGLFDVITGIKFRKFEEE